MYNFRAMIHATVLYKGDTIEKGLTKGGQIID